MSANTWCKKCQIHTAGPNGLCPVCAPKGDILARIDDALAHADRRAPAADQAAPGQGFEGMTIQGVSEYVTSTNCRCVAVPVATASDDDAERWPQWFELARRHDERDRNLERLIALGNTPSTIVALIEWCGSDVGVLGQIASLCAWQGWINDALLTRLQISTHG
jgi:hypothetical protein